MCYDEVFNQILSSYYFSGFLRQKKKNNDANLTNGLSRMLLEITTSTYYFFIQFDGSSDLAGNTIKAFLYGMIIFIITPLMVKPFLKNRKRKRKVLQFALVFSNCGFIGLPLTAAVLGGSSYLCIYI